jgi:hypothetical protein
MNREQAVRQISSATTRMVAGINQAVLSGTVCLFVFFFLSFYFIFFTAYLDWIFMYSTLFHLPPLRFRCGQRMLVLNPGL